MVSLDDIREHVASLFIMLNKKTVILFRIEFLVVLVTLFFFAMFLMDFYRPIIHNSFMRAVFSIFDAVSDSIVVYLLGAMQTAPFKNQLFPVWALVLVNFRYSADYISGYGVPDRRGRRFTEWRNVFKLLGSAFLNWTRGSSFSGPLWLVWWLQIVRSTYRFASHNLASRAVWHGGSSELVAEHMRAMHEDGDQVRNRKGELMERYRYLVYGETKQKKGAFKLKKPQYALSLSTDQDHQDGTKTKDGSKTSCPADSTRKDPKWWCQKKKMTTRSLPLIKLNMFWDQKVQQGNNKADQQQPQDQQQAQQGKAVTKDLPLAFALSRLLRCRFEDVTLQQCIFDTNRDLVKSIIGGKVGVSDALRIMELQLAFVHDYFNTRYPMVFWCGLPSLFFSLLLSVLTMGAVVWLAVDIRKVFKPPSGELANLVKGFNVDTIITWLFIVLMIVKEMWEILTYLHSDWTRLIMACEYVQRKLRESKPEFADTWKDCVLLYFSRSSKITDKRWHGFIDQYVFVESCDDRPRFWNLMHNLTTGIVPKKEDGAKLSSAVQVPECVREAIMNKLSKLTDLGGVAEVPGANCPGNGQAGHHGLLPGSFTTLSDDTNLNEELKRYKSYTARRSSATDDDDSIILPTASHIILVWHIATSLCEMELATTHGINLGSPGFPCSVLSWLSSLFSSKPYLMDVDDKKGCCCCCSSSFSWFTNCWCSSSSKSSDGKTEDKKQQVNGKLPQTYIIANSLSRYCAYLLVSKPDLIPDSFLVPKKVFQKAVKSARDGIFKGTGSLQERHEALKDEAEKAQGTQALKDDGAERDVEDVLKQGAALGKKLLDHLDEERRWKILADVWTELLIHIAPTWNAQAHRKCLSTGEYITHVWALLWHYGIQKSSLWPKDTGTEKSETKSEVEGGGDQAAAGIESRPTGGNIVRDRDHIGIPIDEADDNKEKEKGTKELEVGDSSTAGTGQLRMEGTGRLEIEEVPPDATTNVQRGMVGRAQNERQ